MVELNEEIKRKVVIKNATFITSAAKSEQFITPQKPMIAVCGKSNVGKSSFINMLANRKKLDKNDNELLVPSALIAGFAFVANIIFYSICIIVKSNNIKLFTLYTIIFHCVIVSLLLIAKPLTDYIRKQHK